MKFSFLSALLCMLGGLSAAAQPCTLRLTGHVHTSTQHENLGSATVRIEGGTTTATAANGDFRFDSLCAGVYTLHISYAGFDTTLPAVQLGRHTHLDIDLPVTGQTLSGVTVRGMRGLQSTGIKRELTGREFDETRGRSLAEALSKLNGVTMLQTGANIAKPVIHGLHSNRILTINNGVRQEGQQWGAEHAPEIDPFIADRLTVIKGVDELRYGSDAIGGVVLVDPRALRSSPGQSLEANAIYFSNNRQWVGSAIWEQQLRHLPALTYRLQATLKRGANAATPQYRLNNTAIREATFSATAGWRQEHFNTELYYSLFHTEVGIFSGAHIGNLADLQTAIAAPRPDPTYTGQRGYAIDRPRQEVTHHLLKSKTVFDVKNNRFTVLLAGQYNQRQEYDVVRNAAAKGAQIDLSLLTLSQDITWEHPRVGGFNGTVGVVAMQQDNSYSGRYLIPNYRAYSYGAYAIEKWSRGRWDAQAGLRFDTRDIATSRLQTVSQVFPSYDFDFVTTAASVNVGYKILTGWKANAALSLSARAPQVNELLVNGIHHGTGTYELGNINLHPERSSNASINSSYANEAQTFSAELTLYHNRISDFIFRQPKPEEPVLTIRGAFPKLEYQSTDARLQGVDASATATVYKGLQFTGRYSMLRARNLRIDDWLILMPADRMSAEFSYTFDKGKRLQNSYLSAEVQHVMRQTRVPSDRNGRQDYKVPPAAYTLLHAEAATTVYWGGTPITISLGARNLLNTAYRDYLNAFRYFTDELGRNISLRVKLALGGGSQMAK